METPKIEAPKLPDMVMCGDHPSFTKTELNAKMESKVDDKEKDKMKEKVLSYAKISPSGSRTERPERGERGERGERIERVERVERVEQLERSEKEARARAASEHALRLSEARRRVRSLEVVQRPELDVQAAGNRALVQAALGSFRWPPYLLCVWVLVLVLTHVLHCLVSLLERALPTLRKCTQFFRAWTEETWRGEMEVNQRVYPVALAAITALLYMLYYTLYACYAVVLWAIEPLCNEPDDKSRINLDTEPKITNYDEEINISASCKS